MPSPDAPPCRGGQNSLETLDLAAVQACEGIWCPYCATPSDAEHCDRCASVPALVARLEQTQAVQVLGASARSWQEQWTGKDREIERLEALLEQRTEALEAAKRWLVAIRDDTRDGRGEIAYDQFAYERRENEYRTSAHHALLAIEKLTLSQDTKEPT